MPAEDNAEPPTEEGLVAVMAAVLARRPWRLMRRIDKTLKPVVPGRMEDVLMPPPTVSRQPKLGHIARALMPRRFYI
jgi:hypothetical protein